MIRLVISSVGSIIFIVMISMVKVVVRFWWLGCWVSSCWNSGWNSSVVSVV